jgi:hypothetical protein
VINANLLIGSHDVVLMTLDTLRYDVAVSALESGLTPNMQSLLPSGQWELRHTPGSFTFAAHQAFFAGFLPTPASPGPHPRLFACSFPGSQTTCEQTCVFESENIVRGFADRGYHTACIGGVGFFNKLTELGSVLPNMFAESHWSQAMGVTSRDSTEIQIQRATQIIGIRLATIIGARNSWRRSHPSGTCMSKIFKPHCGPDLVQTKPAVATSATFTCQN